MNSRLDGPPGPGPKAGRTPYLIAPSDPAAPLRLFCFHHAGGGATAFAGWQSALGPSVAVLPVQLPGRERRIREPRFTDMAALVQELDGHLDPYLREPHVFYGHSMGALVAWNLTQLRLSKGRRLPDALLVGACVPPNLPPLSASTRGMSPDRLAQWLFDMGGMSSMVLKYPEWVQAATSLLRDDLDLCDSYWYSEHGEAPPLPCPIHAFAGAADALVSAEVMAGWADHTREPSELFTVPGGHLFIRDSADQFLSLLTSVLARVGSVSREGIQLP